MFSLARELSKYSVILTYFNKAKLLRIFLCLGKDKGFETFAEILNGHIHE